MYSRWNPRRRRQSSCAHHLPLKTSARPIFELTQLEQRVLLSNNVSINFQPSSSDIPTGYLADNGAAYADRGNGYTYGWSDVNGPADNTSYTRDRNNAISPDQRYDTAIYMSQGVQHSWKIDLPNGT